MALKCSTTNYTVVTRNINLRLSFLIFSFSWGNLAQQVPTQPMIGGKDKRGENFSTYRLTRDLEWLLV